MRSRRCLECVLQAPPFAVGVRQEPGCPLVLGRTLNTVLSLWGATTQAVPVLSRFGLGGLRPPELSRTPYYRPTELRVTSSCSAHSVAQDGSAGDSNIAPHRDPERGSQSTPRMFRPLTTCFSPLITLPLLRWAGCRGRVRPIRPDLTMSRPDARPNPHTAVDFRPDCAKKW